MICEMYPVILPEEDGYFGAAAVHIVSDTPGVFVRFGRGNIAFMHYSPNVAMKGMPLTARRVTLSFPQTEP